MKGDKCTIQNCEKIVKTGKICEIHAWRFRKYQSYDLPERSQICKVEGCEKLKDKSQGSAYCGLHRVRRSRYKSIDIPVRPGLPNGIAMICIHHGKLTIEEVYKNGNYKYNRCRECRRISNEKYKKNNPNKKITKNFYFIGNKKSKLRISIIDYEKLYKQQNGLCKICNQPETMKSARSNSSKRLAVDHCHKTQKIRSLLCHYCNISLGGFKESIDILKSAIKYLEEN